MYPLQTFGLQFVFQRQLKGFAKTFRQLHQGKTPPAAYRISRRRKKIVQRGSLFVTSRCADDPFLTAVAIRGIGYHQIHAFRGAETFNVPQVMNFSTDLICKSVGGDALLHQFHHAGIHIHAGDIGRAAAC